jgi:hypothetical protein
MGRAYNEEGGPASESGDPAASSEGGFVGSRAPSCSGSRPKAGPARRPRPRESPFLPHGEKWASPLVPNSNLALPRSRHGGCRCSDPHVDLVAKGDLRRVGLEVIRPDGPAQGRRLALLSRKDDGRGGPPRSVGDHDPRERSALAWTGVLDGFAAKLRADLGGLSGEASTTLQPILRKVVDEFDETDHMAHENPTS